MFAKGAFHCSVNAVQLGQWQQLVLIKRQLPRILGLILLQIRLQLSVIFRYVRNDPIQGTAVGIPDRADISGYCPVDTAVTGPAGRLGSQFAIQAFQVFIFL